MKDHLKDFVFILQKSIQQTNPIQCIHVQDIFSIRRFSQLIRTITSTHLIDHHQENTNHQTKLASTMNLMENLDQSEEDERIKRLECEHLILGQLLLKS